MCGIFAVTGDKNASRLGYFSLYALQHRGQESAGIAVYDGREIHAHQGMGLVSQVFTEQDLERMQGSLGIGHIRYSTTGKPDIRNTQPFVFTAHGSNFAFAHNGNLTNAYELRKELEGRGAIFKASSDSEIFMHLISFALLDKSLEDAILYASEKVEGSFCFLLMNEGRLFVARDSYGFHPLVMGKNGENSFVFASETSAFDLIGAEYIRDVLPGEMIVIESDSTMRSRPLPKKTQVSQCIFELIYFARPDSQIFGEDVYACRKRMGAMMVKEKRVEADILIPFPDSGVYSALGAAQELKIPYEPALIRNHYVGRTFIQPSQSMRDFSSRVKLNPVSCEIKDKKLVVVDDSIVRGTTVRTRCAKLRDIGATEIHFRVSCPPIKFPCFYGIDFPSYKELVANKYDSDELADVLGLDSLHYLTIEGLKSCVSDPENYCYACFDGKYPAPIPKNADKMLFEL